MSIDVVGIGVSPLDIVVLIDHLPNEEEVQQARDMAIHGGGPVASALATVGKLGGKAAMIDVLADDWKGAAILRDFTRYRVATDHIKIIQGADSPSAVVLVSSLDGSRSIIFHPGSVAELSPSVVPYSVIESARFLHVNGRHWAATLEAVRYARQAKVRVSFDGGAHRYRPEIEEILPLVDVCIVARDFASKFSNTSDIDKCGRRLLSVGPSIVVITDGVNGSWVFSNEHAPFHQPAFSIRDVIDTTGCGDSYHGAFIFGLLKGWDLPKTSKFASAVAALNSRSLGGRKALSTLEEVLRFMEKHNAGVESLVLA